MAAQLNIKDEETVRLARSLAIATGEPITQAIKIAVQERLDHVGVVDRAKSERLMAIGRRSAADLKPPYMYMSHGDVLYDELGLPR